MFVRNDVTVDARVLKEAATLTAAGHGVTIIGTARPNGPAGVEREQRDGAEDGPANHRHAVTPEIETSIRAERQRQHRGSVVRP